jgi:hypothetical protein
MDTRVEAFQLALVIDPGIRAPTCGVDKRGQATRASRDLPGLSREYRLVLAEIDSLTTEEGVSVVDQLAERRSAKGSAGATGSA